MMRDKWKLVDSDCRDGDNGIITYHVVAFDEGWQASAAQYSERIKELEQQNEQLQAQVAMLSDALLSHNEVVPITAQTAEAYRRRVQANGIGYVLSKMKFGEITSDELRRMAAELKEGE